MKTLADLNLKPLSRAELSTIKGGETCAQKVAECGGPKCGHFTTEYDAFAICIGNTVTGCSPLGQWGTICGNFN